MPGKDQRRTPEAIQSPDREHGRFAIVGSGDRWRVVELSPDWLPGLPLGDWMTHAEVLVERDRLFRSDATRP